LNQMFASMCRSKCQSIGQCWCRWRFYFCLSTYATDVFKFLCQLSLHKWASNLHQMYTSMCRSNCLNMHLIYASMCRANCQSVGQCWWPVIFWISVCLPTP
jgi:hypothetical protein